MTTFGSFRSRAAAAPARRPGCCTPRSNPVPAVTDPPGRTGSARPRGAGRCRRPAGRAGTRPAGTTRGRAWWRRLSSKVPIRSRSERSRSRSTSATERRAPLGKRSVSASSTPFSQIIVWPSQARSVVDSPSPAGGVDVGGEAARRRRAGQQAAVLGAADRDRAAGQVGQHRRAGQRGLRARRHRHQHVLADLDVQHEARHVRRRRTAGRGRTARPPRPSGSRRARRRPAAIWRRS